MAQAEILSLHVGTKTIATRSPSEPNRILALYLGSRKVADFLPDGTAVLCSKEAGQA